VSGFIHVVQSRKRKKGDNSGGAIVVSQTTLVDLYHLKEHSVEQRGRWWEPAILSDKKKRQGRKTASEPGEQSFSVYLAEFGGLGKLRETDSQEGRLHEPELVSIQSPRPKRETRPEGKTSGRRSKKGFALLFKYQLVRRSRGMSDLCTVHGVETRKRKNIREG